MIKVLGLVSFRVYPTHMGGQKGVALFYEHLQEHLKVILAGSIDNVETDRLKMIRLLHPNRKMYLNFFHLGQLQEIIASEQVDIIIAEHSYTGWLAQLLKKRTGKPFIIHSHNIESRRFRKMNKWWWKWYLSYEKKIHRRADFNFFISQEDLEFAVKEFQLDKVRCEVVTYGVEENSTVADVKALRKALGLDTETTILLFNGTLDYEPNYEAVMKIIDHIEPLLQTSLQDHHIIITGNRAPRELAEKMLGAANLTYLGYVEDVNLYYQCADLFINPVANDSGIKTKLVEAMANHCTTVSTDSGASGIQKNLCGDKLHTVADGDWQGFAAAIVSTLALPVNRTPAAFFQEYSWKHIAEKASKRIEAILH